MICIYFNSIYLSINKVVECDKVGLITGYEFILSQSNRSYNNFYLNEKQQIEYIISDEQRRWIEKKIVFEEPIKDFFVEIDQQDLFHILSVSNNGNINYHTSHKDGWIHKTLKEYHDKTINIYYPTIKVINNIIHIFYYATSKNKNNKCDLIHMTSNCNDNNIWKERILFRINYQKYINPFHIFFNNGELFILATTLIEKFTQIFIVTYDYQHNILKEKIQVTSSPIEKLYLYGLFDKNSVLHISWCEFDEKGLKVMYTNSSVKCFENDRNILSLSERSNCSFPILLYYYNHLWCIWTQMNKLYASYSSNGGTEWSVPMLRKESQLIDFKLYGYKTNIQQENDTIICNYLYGSLYPQIQFLGFGGKLI